MQKREDLTIDSRMIVHSEGDIDKKAEIMHTMPLSSRPHGGEGGEKCIRARMGQNAMTTVCHAFQNVTHEIKVRRCIMLVILI